MAYYGGDAQQADPKFLMDRLMQRGYSRMQAAAIVGNMQRESGLATNSVNKDEGAYGLMQWRGPRFQALQQFAAGKGVPWTDPGLQADFMAHEMATTESKNAAPFLNARSVDEATAALAPVIRYGDQSLPQRTMFARNLYGADDAAPQGPDAPKEQSLPPRTSAAQPAPTRASAYARAAGDYGYGYDRYGYGQSGGRPLRQGLGSLGDLGAALVQRQRSGQPLFGGGQPPPGGAPVPPVGVPPAPAPGIAQVPAAAREDAPLFPGGVPLPRPRPLTGPPLPPDDRIVDPTQDVAALGSLVDPTTGYDYG
jgi:hypothetical protein